METLIVALVGCLVFALCFGILVLRARDRNQPVKLHMCGQEDDCQCKGRSATPTPFDLKKVLEKARDPGDQA